MKSSIMAWIIPASFSSAALFEDGKGFFPVVVQVVEANSGTPIKGVKVSLENPGSYSEVDTKLKIINAAFK